MESRHKNNGANSSPLRIIEDLRSPSTNDKYFHHHNHKSISPKSESKSPKNNQSSIKSMVKSVFTNIVKVNSPGDSSPLNGSVTPYDEGGDQTYTNHWRKLAVTNG